MMDVGEVNHKTRQDKTRQDKTTQHKTTQDKGRERKLFDVSDRPSFSVKKTQKVGVRLKKSEGWSSRHGVAFG
jgi:hypothetical protein